MTADLLFHRTVLRDEPEGSLVLLHGHGSDEEVMRHWIDLLDPAGVLNIVLVRGPVLTLWDWAWFDLGERDLMARQMTESAQRLGELMAGLEDTVLAGPLAVGGFSQGGVMALVCGLGVASGPSPRAGLLSFAGWLPTELGFSIHPSADHPPVLLANGTKDERGEEVNGGGLAPSVAERRGLRDHAPRVEAGLPPPSTRRSRAWPRSCCRSERTGLMPDASAVVTAAPLFGLGNLIGAPSFAARGAMGEVWRLDTDTGTWAVKVMFRWNTPPACPADVVVQELAGAAGVLLPRPLRTLVGEVVVRAAGRSVRVYEWVDFAAPVGPPIGVARAADAGWLLGRIHSLDLDTPAEPVEPWYTTPPTGHELALIVDRARGAGAVWAPLLDASIGAMVDLDRLTAGAPGAAIVGHRDFDPSNVLPRRDDGQLVVIDWENAGPIPADWELGGALENWVCPAGPADPAPLVEAFLDGYRKGGGTAVIVGPSSFRSTTAAFCNYIRVLTDLVLDDPDEAANALPQLTNILEGGVARLRTKIESILAVLT